jgi:hypothetical protein
MRIDLKAVSVAFIVFLAIFLPTYLRFTSYDFTNTVFSYLAPWLTYLAPFFSGLAMAYLEKINTRFNSILLSALISLSLGLANFIGPSDLPGFYYSFWVTGLSLPIVLFLVAAGLGAKSLIKALSNEIKP